MNQMPIKRKFTNYPKDFSSNNCKPTVNNPKFDVNEQLSRPQTPIRSYDTNTDTNQKQEQNTVQKLQQVINPQKFTVRNYELEQDRPLNPHSYRQKPDLNVDAIKKPKFSLNSTEQIPQKFDLHLQNSTSPGSIRKQLENRQTPLPLSDPFKIELVKSPHQRNSKVPDSVIKFKASADIDSRRWLSSEKDFINKFKESRLKRSHNQLPVVSKNSFNGSMTSIIAKEQYQNFKRRQRSLREGSMSKVSHFLASIKKKQSNQQSVDDLPRFQSAAVQKLRDQINLLARIKKGTHLEQHQSDNYGSQESANSEEEDNGNLTSANRKKSAKLAQLFPNNGKLPQYLVSYRSSLSYLKDLYQKILNQQQYKLIVKIPKLFTQKLIFKHQQKAQLYQVSKDMLQELNLPFQNITIKRYTNCIMIISRNICLIWHYDGKRYLGGWQTQYLDQGFKHGLGLQWQPKSYVYYGEFVRNKKEGLGVYKDRNQVVYVGYWKKGRRFQQDRTDYDVPMAGGRSSQNYEQYQQQYDQEREYEYI